MRSGPWPFPGEINVGDEGNAVRAWQDRLIESDLLEAPANGTFDEATAESLESLRKALKLKKRTRRTGEGDEGAEEAVVVGDESMWEAWAESEQA